jgi:hypothetical protein
MIDSFLKNGGIELDYDILPFRCRDDFIGTKVRLATLNTWAIGTVAPVNFAAKWHVGRIRPEEIAWLIAKGDISERDGANADVVNLIKSMNLTNTTCCTQYPEGCPNHLSWPAMHSAKSSASLWLAVIAKLTPDQYCQALRTDFAVAYARTVAGVHYVSDNIAGLNMGQTVIAEELADHLERTYGSNKAAVEAKIKKLRFDWNMFDSEKCTVTYGTPTRSLPTPAPATPAPAPRSCVEVDFSCTADNSPVSRGDYVEKEWAKFGLTLSAAGGYSTRPRVFDTANTGNNDIDGDSDLGSPNKRCKPAGPGVGKGGEPDEKGANCTPLCNVLIVQERNQNMDIPDDNVSGGSIIFDFEPEAQFVSKIGLLDVDYKTSISVLYKTQSGKVTRKTIKAPPILGDNSYQELPINMANVSRVTLTMERSGAVSSISFCY